MSPKQFRITVVIDRAGARQWHLGLARRLRKQGHEVFFIERGEGSAAPAGLDLLLQFERLAFKLRDADSVARATIGSTSPPHDVDLTIDLSSSEEAPESRTLSPRFDQGRGEVHALGALLERTAPRVEIVLTQEGSQGVVASGVPALQAPDILTNGWNAVVSCAQSLLVGCVDALARGDRLDFKTVSDAACARRTNAASFVSRTLANRIAAKLTRLAIRGNHFRIGWRVADDQAIAKTLAWPQGGYQFLPDDSRRYFADPFLFAHEGKTWVLCEEFPYAAQKGILSAFEITADGKAGPVLPILEEAWHLSYPQVFAADEKIWMIPESNQSGRIDLYCAEKFPDRWAYVATLVEGVAAADATLVEHDGLFWLFATVRGDGLTDWDALHLYYAASMTGPWTPHPLNPVLIDAQSARPAGAMFRRGGALWRPAQDCTRYYGGGISLCEVERLDREGFTQTLRSIVTPPKTSGFYGAHTLNYGGGFEAIDVVGPRWRR